jgi:hypothetical protein
MRRDSIGFVLVWALVLSLKAVAQDQVDGTGPAIIAPASAFLPSPGETLSYRISDTVISSKQSKNEAGTLTLTAVSGDEIEATVALDNKPPRSFALYVDQAGALQPTDQSDQPSKAPRHRHLTASGAADQAFLLRLSLAAQIGARPGEAMAIPVVLNVPWVSSPANPTLYIKPTTADTFAGDASDTITVPPPQNGRSHLLRAVAISAGAGILAGQIGGTAGSVIRPIVIVGTMLIASRKRPGPQPTEVSLHISGELAEGRLQRLSGDQEYSVAQKERSRVFSEQWQFLAQAAPEKARL